MKFFLFKFLKCNVESQTLDIKLFKINLLWYLIRFMLLLWWSQKMFISSRICQKFHKISNISKATRFGHGVALIFFTSNFFKNAIIYRYRWSNWEAFIQKLLIFKKWRFFGASFQKKWRYYFYIIGNPGYIQYTYH